MQMNERGSKKPLKVVLKRAELKHLESIYEIEVLSYRSPWPFNAFYNDFLSKGKSIIVVVVQDENEEEKVVGFIDFACIPHHEVHLLNIAVHPDYRNLGIGKALLDECILIAKKRQVKSIWLEVRVTNLIAIDLYKKSGFQITGIRKGYYSDNGEDAYLMTLKLEKMEKRSISE